MFFLKNGMFFSDFLKNAPISHGFTTRKGGVSVLEHTKEMNIGFGRGDSDDVVCQNIRLCGELSGGDFEKVIFAPQIHSTVIREVSLDSVSPMEPCDGFITKEKGIMLVVRSADCVPILFCGATHSGETVIGAAHAGWRGTVNGICGEMISKMGVFGCDADKIKAAIGPCIHSCCFEVKEDFLQAVTEIRGEKFANSHIKERGGRLYGNLTEMNLEILLSKGVLRHNIDVAPFCTACNPELFHSHRATGGVRGTGGGVICINR